MARIQWINESYIGVNTDFYDDTTIAVKVQLSDGRFGHADIYDYSNSDKWNAEMEDKYASMSDEDLRRDCLKRAVKDAYKQATKPLIYGNIIRVSQGYRCYINDYEGGNHSNGISVIDAKEAYQDADHKRRYNTYRRRQNWKLYKASLKEGQL